MDKEADYNRRLRLQAFFHKKPDIWDDLTGEIDICLKNAQDKIDASNCTIRDWLSGYRAGQKDILKLKEQYQNLDLKEKN